MKKLGTAGVLDFRALKDSGVGEKIVREAERLKTKRLDDDLVFCAENANRSTVYWR